MTTKFSQLPKKTRIIILTAALIAIAALWYMAWRTAAKGNPSAPASPQAQNTDAVPSDFNRIGIVVFNNPGLKADTPYLVFEEPGAPALAKELVFDAESVCTLNTGSFPCLSITESLKGSFDGRRTTAEGLSRPDGTLLVRKLTLEK